MQNFDPLDLQSRIAREEDAREKIRQSRLKECAEIKWLMQEEMGRAIVWRLLNNAGIYRSSYSENALAMAFSEGKREMGLRLLDSLTHECPELYQTMMKENTKNV
ncbi:hypothetical protein [Bartonella sp. OT172YNZD]|uniref:Bbp19 family protein n=1 Tax=Bartonella sp. OT172YNZD TaxID=3243572 RepID=UPI0035D069F0